MPCLTLGKGLFPAIRIWKNFTTKLQRRLHKLHPCKIIKLKKTRRSKNTRAPPPIYYPPFPSRPSQHCHRAGHRHQLSGTSKALHRPKRYHRFKKQPLQAPPVFVDELFWTHLAELDEGLPGSCRAKAEAESATSSAVLLPEMSGRNTSLADEVWESVAVASPLMRGIDDRAEEFITRFRAELEFQEILAHRL